MHLTQLNLVSQIRAVWYVMEVMAQENTDMGSGVVLLISFQNFTMWDYDHELYSRILSSCWPVNIIARHGCFPPSILKIIKPILNALVDKHTRSRVLMHDVPESEILDVLSSYGVQKYMLPTQLGGTVLLDQAKWIASRMAAELEDI
jgi:CRAL/TRIO domain